MNNLWCSRIQFNKLRMNHLEWMSKNQMLKRKCKFLKNQLWHCTQKQNKSEMTLLTTRPNKKLSKKVRPTCSNKPRLPIKLSLRKKLRSKTSPMRFQESESIIWIVFSKMSFLKRNWMIWLLSWKKKKKKSAILKETSRKDTIVSKKDNWKLTNSIEFGLSWGKMVRRKIVGRWKPRRITFWSKQKS